MKSLLFCILVVASLSIQGQTLKERLQGDWVCTGILNDAGNPVSGKFGESAEYLRFSFNKGRLMISETPYDLGLQIEVTFKDSLIDLIPGAIYEVPERIYSVKKLNKSDLVLFTYSPQGVALNYHFTNQNQFDNLSRRDTVDDGIIVVKHIHLSRTNASYINRVSIPIIKNDPIYLRRGPLFDDPKGTSFDGLLTGMMKLPKSMKQDAVTSEMIIEFEVNENGMSGLRFVKGLGEDFDLEVQRVMNKLDKYWKPLLRDGKPVCTVVRFHLYFFMTIEETVLPWEN